MNNEHLMDDLITELVREYKEHLTQPFPYQGCYHLLEQTDARYEALIPDLDMYFYAIASHCGGARKLVRLPREKLANSQAQLQASFFEQHPEYRDLAGKITFDDTPDLYQALRLHEEMRTKVLQLLALLVQDFNEP